MTIGYMHAIAERYKSLGYAPYRWFKAEDPPAWQPLAKPLSSARIGMLSTSGAYALGPISGGHFNPAVSVGLWAGGRFPAAQQRVDAEHGHRLDFHDARALEQIGRFLIHLDREKPSPRRQHGLQKIRDLHERFHDVSARILIILKVRLACIGGEADEFRPLA